MHLPLQQNHLIVTKNLKDTQNIKSQNKIYILRDFN